MAVEGMMIQCEGNDVLEWSACEMPDMGFLLLSPTAEGCDAVRVLLGPSTLGGDALVLSMFGTGTTPHEARIEFGYGSDDDGASDPLPIPTLIAGSVSPEQFAAGGRNTGRFELQYEEGRVFGQYDVSPP